MPTAVMLRPNWPGTFRRTVERDKQNQPVRTLVFDANVPIMVDDADMPALEDALGKSLVLAAVDAEGKPLPKPADRHAIEGEDHPRRRTKKKAKE